MWWTGIVRHCYNKGSLVPSDGLTFYLVFSVNVFYRINQDQHHPQDNDGQLSRERARQEREFKIGSIGFADSSGILLASLLAVPTEISLCRSQVARGKHICAEL